MNPLVAWFAERTAGAPPVLAERARSFLELTLDANTAADRLADAGTTALRAAEGRGSSREAALDLLAADALITLALLDVTERTPDDLAGEAARLRRRAAAGG